MCIGSLIWQNDFKRNILCKTKHFTQTILFLWISISHIFWSSAVDGRSTYIFCDGYHEFNSYARIARQRGNAVVPIRYWQQVVTALVATPQVTPGQRNDARWCLIDLITAQQPPWEHTPARTKRSNDHHCQVNTLSLLCKVDQSPPDYYSHAMQSEAWKSIFT